MKRPIKLEVESFLQKHKILKNIFFIFLVIIFFIFLLNLTSKFSMNINNSLIGIFGAILGSIVGGTLTFLGSVYVNNKQISSKSAIHRKNIIYKPLYDELINNKEIIKREKSYPLDITFSMGRYSSTQHLQYAAWGRIKNDSRFLQTPDFLVQGFEKLNEDIKKYLYIANNSTKDIQTKIEHIFKEHLYDVDPFKNISVLIFEDIILRNKPEGDLLKVISSYQPYLNLETIQKIEDLIYNECNDLESVKNTIVEYNNWLNTQDELIKSLSILIELTSIKYEKINNEY